MKRLLLVPVFGLAVSALAAPAHAQLGGLLDGDRLNYSAEARQPYYEARRLAYDNGYREGLKEGEKDGRRRDQYEFSDEGAWRNGDKGYNRRVRGWLQRRVPALRAGLWLRQRPCGSTQQAAVFDVSEQSQLSQPDARRVLSWTTRLPWRTWLPWTTWLRIWL